MEHAEAGPRPGAEPAGAERRSYLFMHVCVAVAALAVFLAVIVPLLIWAAAIVFAGAR